LEARKPFGLLRCTFCERRAATAPVCAEEFRLSRATPEFVLNGERVQLAGGDPSRPLLEWLRQARGLTGTKEGCAEGDCGACTVLLADLAPGGGLRHRPVTSCILPLGAADGCEIVTVEHLRQLYGGALHPVQRALVEHHGSQCGFCTPGFVLALYAHYKSGAPCDRAALCDALAGNLCRCTGYAPILAAGADMHRHAQPETEAAADAACAARLQALPADALQVGERFFAPRTLAALRRWLAAHPDSCILAGGSDLGLLVTKAHQDLDRVVHVGRVPELRLLEESAEQLKIGAAVTYAEAHAALARLHPDLGELVRRIGGAQVRAVGTLGGNLANASPIGDTMPALLALDATLVLERGAQVREVALQDFYRGYRQTVLEPGEFIRSIRIPRLAAGARFAAYKLSRRFDQDISAVCAAFCVAPDGRARFGFGGMAATPARAPRAEAAWPRGVEAACAALGEDFKPISDHRASAWYRLRAAQALLRRFASGARADELLRVRP
jgi:xanthine dehydrogenase small subunit